MASRIKGITIEIDGSTKGLDKALSDVNSQSIKLQQELKDVERLLKFDPGNTEAMAQKQLLMAERIDNTTQKLQQLRDAQAQVEAQFKSGNLGEKQYLAFKREVQFTEAELKKFKQTLASIDDGNVLGNLKKDFQGVSKEASNAKDAIKGAGGEIAGLVAGAAAGAGISGVVEKALGSSSMNTKIKISMEVPPESMASVKEAISTVSAYGVDAETALEGVRRQWAINYDASDEYNSSVVKGAAAIAAAYSGIDFTELIQETNEISQTFGITGNEALGLTNILLNMGFPPDQLDIISEYGNQLKMAGYNATEIQNIMAAGIQTGTWSIDNLLDGLGEGRKLLSQFGQAVPQAMEQLLQGTNISAQQLQKWGQAVAAGGAGGSKAMQEVALALQGVQNETTRNALGVAIFGTMYEEQGKNITNTLLGAKTITLDLKDGQDKLNASVSNLNADPAVKMQKAMSDLTTASAPMLTTIANIIAKVAEWMSKNPTLAATIAAIVSVIGILAGIIMGLAPIFVAMQGVIAGTSITFGAFLGPVLIVIGVIAALIAISVLLYKNWDSITAWLKQSWTNISNWAVSIFNSIGEFFKKWGPLILSILGGPIVALGIFIFKNWDTIKQSSIQIWNSITAFFSQTWQSIVSVASIVWNGITAFFTNTWNGIKLIFMTVFNAFYPIIMGIWNSIVAYATAVWETIKIVLQTAWDVIKAVFATALLSIWAIVTGHWDQLGQIFQKGGEKIWSLISGMWATIQAIWTSATNYIWANILLVWNTITSIFTTGWNTLTSIVSSLWNSIVQWFTDGLNKTIASAFLLWTTIKAHFQMGVSQAIGFVISFYNDMINWFSSLPGRISSFIQNLWTNIKNWFSNGVSSVVNSISNMVDSIGSWFSSLPDRALSWGKNMIQGFIDGIKAMAKPVTDAVSGVIGWAKDFIGFNSPAKKGEGRNIVKWGANMIGGFIDGIQTALPDLQSVMSAVIQPPRLAINTSYGGPGSYYNPQSLANDVARQVSANLPSGGAGGPIIVPVYLDGREIARVTAPYMQEEKNRIDDQNRRFGGGR